VAKEYIEREALIENLKRFASEHFRELTKMLIEKETAADVVEVVRCKDCVFGKNDTPYCQKYGLIYCAFDNTIKQKNNHFCAYGERKEV
jgi:hypothetical protein